LHYIVEYILLKNVNNALKTSQLLQKIRHFQLYLLINTRNKELIYQNAVDEQYSTAACFGTAVPSSLILLKRSL